MTFSLKIAELGSRNER